MIPGLPDGLDPMLWLVAVALVVGFPAASAVAVARIGARQKGHGEAISSVQEQVTNNHATNLRDDIDKALAKVDQVDTKVDVLVGRFDMLHEDLDDFASDVRSRIDRQDRIAARFHPPDERW